MPSKDNTKCAQCQTTMTTVIYVLCGVSITLSAISIFINAKGGGRMAEEKRKTKTSTAVKQRYIDKTYDIISARVPKELAAAFKAKCAAEGIPQAQIIKKAIEDFLSQ